MRSRIYIKFIKNKLNHSLRIAKRLYYERKLEYVKTNTKNTWKILNEVINKKKKTTRKLPHEFKVNNQMIFNPKLIADRFCDYFTKRWSEFGQDNSKSF